MKQKQPPQSRPHQHSQEIRQPHKPAPPPPADADGQTPATPAPAPDEHTPIPAEEQNPGNTQQDDTQLNDED